MTNPLNKSKCHSFLLSAIIEQNLCRPSWFVPELGNRTDPGEISKIFDCMHPKFSAQGELSGPEKMALNLRLKMHLASKGGKPFVWTEQQIKHRLWIGTFDECFSSQMNPLRALRIHLLSLSITAEIRKGCSKEKVVVLDENHVEMISLSRALDTLILELNHLFFLIEFSLINDVKREAISAQDTEAWLEELFVKLNAIDAPHTKEIPSLQKTISQIRDHLKMLKESTQDRKNLLPLLLIPLGRLDWNHEVPLNTLEFLKREFDVLIHSLDRFVAKIKNLIPTGPYKTKFDRLSLSDQKKLEAQRKQTIEKISLVFERLKVDVATARGSDAIARAFSQSVPRYANQISLVQATFVKALDDFQKYFDAYSNAYQNVSTAVAEWAGFAAKVTQVDPSQIPIAANFKRTFVEVPNFSHELIYGSGYMDVVLRANFFYQLDQLENILKRICKDLSRETSNWFSNRDVIILTIYQNLIGLSRFDQAPEFQRPITGIYFEITTISDLLEKITIGVKTRQDPEHLTQLREQVSASLGLIWTTLNCMQDQFPRISQASHFADLREVIRPLKFWFRDENKSEDLKAEVLGAFLSLKLGPDFSFPSTIVKSILLIVNSYNERMEKFFSLYEIRFDPLKKLGGCQFDHLFQFLSDLKVQFLKWQEAVAALPSVPKTQEMLNYVSACLAWQRTLAEIDCEQIEQIWDLFKTKAKEQEHLTADRRKQFLDWADNCKEDLTTFLQELIHSTRGVNKPLLEWGEPLLIDGNPIEQMEQSRIKEVFYPIDDEKTEDPLPSLSLPPAALQSRRIYTFDEVESALKAVKFEDNAYSKQIKTTLAILREELYSAGPEAFPFSHAQILFFHASIVVEQTLKYLISQQKGLDPHRKEALMQTHSYSELLDALKRPFEKSERASLMGLENLYLSGRYLRVDYGGEAESLRRLAESPKREVVSELIDAAHKKITHILGIVQSSLSDQLPPKLEGQKPLLIRAPKIHPDMKAPIAQASALCDNLSRLQGILQLQNASHGSARENKISQALEYSAHYLKAIKELLLHACNPHASFGRSNGLLLNVSLLLEQTLISLMASLDIFSQQNSETHALFERVGRGGQSRPRFHDHNLEALLKVVMDHIRHTDELPPLILTLNENNIVTEFKHFIGGASRYLSDSQGALKDILQDLRDLSNLYHALEIDWLQEQEAIDLKRRYGELSKDEWKSKVAEEILTIQKKAIYPKVIQILQMVEKLMRYRS